jgi:hypothetical protein
MVPLEEASQAGFCFIPASDIKAASGRPDLFKFAIALDKR